MTSNLAERSCDFDSLQSTLAYFLCQGPRIVSLCDVQLLGVEKPTGARNVRYIKDMVARQTRRREEPLFRDEGGPVSLFGLADILPGC